MPHAAFAIDFGLAAGKMSRMEDAVSIWYQVLQWTLLIGGTLALGVIIRNERCNPPDRDQLTEVITQRAWKLVQVFLLLATLLLLYTAAGFTGQFFQGDRQDWLPYIQLGITVIIYGILMLEMGIISRRAGNGAEDLGMGLSSLRKIGLAPLVYLATIPLIIAASKLYQFILTLIFTTDPELQEVAQIVSREWSLLKTLYVGMAIFVAPVYEELLYRGVFFPYLVKRSCLLIGTLVSSVLFAVMHNNAGSLISLTLLSMVLSLAYWRTGSLWVSIGVHMIFNAITILALNI